MIYKIEDLPPLKETILYAIQLLLSIFVATVLIANICGVAVSGALFGAGFATCIYIMITRYKSPMFVSNSGAFVAPVMMALAAGGYTAVAVGALTTCIVYCIFGAIFTKIPVENIYKVFPRALIGTVTMVIGITLMGFINTYVQIDGVMNMYGIFVALATAVVTAIISHYAKGLAKILPFLLGTLFGYALSVILTLTGVCKIVDFSVFKNIGLLSWPDFAILHWSSTSFKVILPIIVVYIAYPISAMCECLSDHAALGGIIGVDLYKDPGLGKIFVGEGVETEAQFRILEQLGCDYIQGYYFAKPMNGEGVACVGFSRVASTVVTYVAALFLMLLACIVPVQAFIASIPSCVFGGVAIILYGYIACSGVKMLQKVDLNNQKNLIMVSSVLSLGVSGLAVGGTTFALSGTALGLVFGVTLNLLLKEKNNVAAEP